MKRYVLFFSTASHVNNLHPNVLFLNEKKSTYFSRITLRRTVKAAMHRALFLRAPGARGKLSLLAK